MAKKLAEWEQLGVDWTMARALVTCQKERRGHPSAKFICYASYISVSG